MKNIEQAYKVFCKQRFPLPSDTRLADFEARIGVSLPSEYRHYLLEYNGGWFTEPRILPPSNDCPLDRLTSMFGLETEQRSLELESYLGLFDDNSPPQILGIGYTMMGNLIYLVTDPEGEDCGCIALKKAYSDECFFLAGGIEEFFGLLRVIDAPFGGRAGYLQ